MVDERLRHSIQLKRLDSPEEHRSVSEREAGIRDLVEQTLRSLREGKDSGGQHRVQLPRWYG